MTKRLGQLRKRLAKIFNARLGVIVSAAILLELIGIVQFYFMRNTQREAVERRVRTEMLFKSLLVSNMLNNAELSLQEHLWDIQTHLKDADAMFGVTGRLIAANSQIVGGCIAFAPNYYPKKGRLFEPYASKRDSIIVYEQLASDNHDYTQHPAFQKALSKKQHFWSDPYIYEGATRSYLTTYTYPIVDEKDSVVALCGLDIDLSWLRDTLNARHVYPSSFSMMFTQKGKFVVQLDDSDERKSDIGKTVSLICDSLAARPMVSTERFRMIDFTSDKNGRKGCAYYTVLQKDPYWVLSTINYYDEVYESVMHIRLINILMMLAGLLIIFFIINRFVRSEHKLQAVNIEQARISRELQIASGIQQDILPKTYPPYPERKDIDIYGTLLPAKEVGGDLFDFFIRDEKLYFCIGDVSGKGVPSAIVMSMVQKLMRMASAHDKNPSSIIHTMNEELSRDNTTNMFITFFLGVLDLPTGRLRYCNAGHDNPIILQRGDEGNVTLLPVKTNLPIGVFSDYRYESEEYQLPEECIIFLYTDGLTEAKNIERQQFRIQRVTDSLSRFAMSSTITPQQLLNGVTAEVKNFVGTAEQSDDLTMLAISYRRPANKDFLQHSITLQNDLSQVPQLNDFVKQLAADMGMEKKEMRQLQLAVEETVVNVISYAYPPNMTGDITVSAAWNGERVKLTVTDNGIAFDPTLTVMPDITLSADERPIGGLGILLTRRLVDSINYERVDNKNVLTLRKFLT